MKGLEKARYEAQRSFRKRIAEKETQNPSIIAKVGNGAGTVTVPGRSGWVYVRLHGDDNQLTEAKLGIPLNTAELNDAWVKVRRASPRKASYYVVEQFISSSGGDPTPPLQAHPLDPDDGPHTGALTEDQVVFADTGHPHSGGTGGKKVDAANVVNTPSGGISATDVQAALNELDTEKLAEAEFTGKGDLLVGTGVGTFVVLPVGADGEVLTVDSLEASSLKYAEAAGGGGMTPFWEFRGALGVLVAAGTPVRMPYAGTIEAVLLLVETKGSAGSTIIDVNKAGVTIFTTQANRPEVAFDDPDDFDIGVPDIAAFDQYDEFTVDFDQVGTDSEDAWVLIICAMTAGDVTVEVQEDDVKVVDARIFNFEGGGGKVTDEGGGKVTVDITPGSGGGLDYYTLADQAAVANFTNTSYVTVGGHGLGYPHSGNTKIEVRLISFMMNSTAGQTTFIQLVYQKNDASTIVITGSEISQTGTTWAKKDSGWIDITSIVDPQETIGMIILQTKVSGGTGQVARPTTIMRITP